MPKQCKIRGCVEVHYGHGYCARHYQEAKRRGLLDAPLCAVDECSKAAVCKGYCPKHYQRFKKHGSVRVVLKSGVKPGKPKKSCKDSSCERPAVARQMCRRHYLRALRAGELGGEECSVDGCIRARFACGLCDKHLQRFAKYGDVNFTKRVLNPTREHKRKKATERMRRYRKTPHGRIRTKWSRGKKRVTTGWIIPGVTKE